MEFLSWNPLWCLLLVVGLAVFARWSLVDRPKTMKWISLGCRIAAIICLILALCRPFWASDRDEVHVSFLLDVSESVDLDSMARGLDEIQKGVDRLDGDDSHVIFLFAKGIRRVSLDEAREYLKQCQAGRGDAKFRSETRFENAIAQLRLSLPAEKAKRIVVLSDGLINVNPEGILRQLDTERTDLRIFNLDSLKQPEASITEFAAASPTAFFGEVARLKVRMGSNKDMGARLRILHRGVSVAEKSVSLKAGETVDEFVEVEMVSPGNSEWEAHLEPEEDYFPVNNKAATTISVTGKPKILAIHDKKERLRAATRSLKEQGIEMEVRGARGLPDSLRGMLAYDAIMLADVAATSLEPAQMEWLKQYVVDFGGGLIMTGSENSFGLGGYYKTPIEDVLPLVSRFEKEKQKPSLAMVLVIDKSGSMSGNPIVLARKAARSAAELLGNQDQICVIGFDSNPQMILDLTHATNRGKVATAIDSLAAGGGTNMAPAMEQAKQVLMGANAKIKHVIAMTDGQTPQANLLELTQDMAASGMTVSTVAMGSGASKQLLASIAEIGRGRYYETDDPENVPQIFTKETMQASRSAIKEDLYTVSPVNEHPMITGYEEVEFPMILGYVMTRIKPTAHMILAAESGDTLLASGQFGLGKGVAFTADLTDKWGSEWLAWDNFGPFWAQVIRAALKRDDAVGLSVTSDIQDDQWHIRIRRSDEAGAHVNAIDWKAEVYDEDGNSTPVTIEETGLGFYQASVPLKGNRMALQLVDAVYGKMKTLQWTRSYPNEYRLSSPYQKSIQSLETYIPEEVRSGVRPVVIKTTALPLFGFLALFFVLLSLVFRRV